MTLSQSVDDAVEFESRDWLYSILEKRFYFVKSLNVYLTKLHIQQILKKKRRCLSFRLDVFVTNQKEINEFMIGFEETTLIIECVREIETNKKLFEFDFNNYENFHVIFIGSNDDYLNFSFKSHVKIELIENQDYNLNDLIQETRNYLLENRMVIFQGKKVSLKKLMTKSELFGSLRFEVLEKLIRNETDIEFQSEIKSNVAESFIDYYIPRQFKRFIQIDRKSLNLGVKDFLIVDTEHDFEEKCQQRSRKKIQKRKKIHYLKHEEDNQNLIWQKSSGPISDLKPYLIKEEKCCLLIGEDEILNQNEKILIISADPGMGKSTILNKLKYDSNSEIFFIEIVLNNFTTTFKQIKDGKIKLHETDCMDFILELFLGKSDQLQKLILKNLANEEKLILMFDGLDEVSDYKEQVKILIKILSDNYRLKKILVTTRNSLKEELEDCFETISFNLNDFEREDQINFFVKYWKTLNKNKDKSNLYKTAQVLLEKIESSFTKNISQLIGIPLQAKMLADIYPEGNVERIRIKNIADMYHEFIEKKFNIQFEEKCKREIAIDQDDYEEKKEKYYGDHIKLSLLILSKIKETSLNIEEKKIIKFGLIVNFENKIPIFLHQSFAEFFVAKNALNQIIQNKQNEILNEILKNTESFLIRKFLNDLLGEKPIENINLDLNVSGRDYNDEIENCCRENLFSLLKYLLERRNASIKTYNIFLNLASEKGHKEIVELLIQNGIDVNQQDKIFGRNALHWASWKNHKEIVEFLLEKGIDINRQNHAGSTALHCATKEGHKKICELLKERGIDINIKDDEGKTASNWASERDHKEIVELLSC